MCLLLVQAVVVHTETPSTVVAVVAVQVNTLSKQFIWLLVLIT
jgi:hypothetical protein